MSEPASKRARHRSISKAVNQHLTDLISGTLNTKQTKSSQHVETIADNESSLNMNSIVATIKTTLLTTTANHEPQDTLFFEMNKDHNFQEQSNKLPEEHRAHSLTNEPNSNVTGKTIMEFHERDYDEFFEDSDSNDDISEHFHDEETQEDVKELLCDWALRFHISHIAINALLRILSNGYISNLPLDARTLLKTPRTCDVRVLDDGQYVHYGLRAGIEKKLKTGLKNEDINYLTVNTNVDGLPLYKSKGTQFWPILCCVNEANNNAPFTVGVYCGEKKPSSPAALLCNYIEEAKDLQNAGIVYKTKQLQVNFTKGLYLCDAPARSFLKCCKQHNSYHACERCSEEGDWVGRIIFRNVKANLRTDATFNSQEDSEHHTGLSPLLHLNIGLVTQFVLDPMHLVYLGVMRRFLFWWVQGPLKTRLCAKKSESCQQILLL